MFKWTKSLIARYLERILPATDQYAASAEPQPLQVIRARPVESIVGTRLTSIHAATWFNPTHMKAIFVYGLSDATYVRFGFWIDELKTCEEVVLNADFHEVLQVHYGNGDRDPRWCNRKIIDVMVPRELDLRHEDEQGLLLDSGCVLFQSTSEPRGCSPSVVLSTKNPDEMTGLLVPDKLSMPIQEAQNKSIE